MPNVWVFLTIFLDVFPWIFLQYRSFQSKLRRSYGATLAVCSFVMLLWQTGFVWLAAQPFCTLDQMLAYRVAQIFLLAALSCVMIRAPLSQSVFVFSLMFPCMMLVLTTASFIAGRLPANALPPYQVTSLLRLALSALMFALVRWLFRRFLLPVMAAQEDDVWRSAWPIPASFTLISFIGTENDFELVGVSAREWISRVALFGGVLAACLMLFRTIRQAEIRTRAAEEAEKSKLLLALEAEQYRALTDGIAETRKARHDLRQHLSVLSDMARQGALPDLQRYIARMTDTLPLESVRLSCEHPAASAILRHYIAQAEAAGIAVSVEANIPADIGVEDTDLAILLGNLLENAVEACACLPVPARVMEIKARMQGRRLFLVLANACDPDAARSKGGALSRKRGYREAGIGLISVRAVVNKYDGEWKRCQTNDRFTVSVMLREPPRDTA